MKKLILSVAVLLGSLSTFATILPSQITSEKIIIISDEYTEIKLEELPTAVTDALKKAYPEAEITKAYINENKEYRIDIKMADQEGALYADANGKWIQK